MKITQQQLMLLYQILQDSIKKDIVKFGISYGDRMKLINKIINQQDDKLIDIGE